MAEERKLTESDLVAGGQGLIRMIALRIHRRFYEKFELDDLISFGQVGLAQAARTFNSEKGLQFSTFAYYRVRGSIYEGIEKMGWGSRAMHRKARFLTKANDLFEPRVEPPPLPEPTTLDDDARWLGAVTEQLVVVSFATLGRDAESDAGFESDRDVDPADEIAAREIHEHLRRLVAELPDEPRILLEMMYFEGSSLQEAATAMKISKGWASKLHARALGRLGVDLRALGVEQNASSADR
jgi:RNA polymerase sigma factor for flagellar operon FliA